MGGASIPWHWSPPPLGLDGRKPGSGSRSEVSVIGSGVGMCSNGSNGIRFVNFSLNCWGIGFLFPLDPQVGRYGPRAFS